MSITMENRRWRCGQPIAVIANNRETANRLFGMIAAGELPCLYPSATEAEATLKGWPLGISTHYRVFTSPNEAN